MVSHPFGPFKANNYAVYSLNLRPIEELRGAMTLLIACILISYLDKPCPKGEFVEKRYTCT